MIPQIILRAVSLFGGIAVQKAVNNVLPVSIDLVKKDAVGAIGTVLIQAAAADVVMSYIEGRIVGALDSIAAVKPQQLEVIPPAQPTQPEPQPTVKPATKQAKQ